MNNLNIQQGNYNRNNQEATNNKNDSAWTLTWTSFIASLAVAVALGLWKLLTR